MKPIAPFIVAACLYVAAIPARAQTTAAGKVDLTFTQTNSFLMKPNAPIVAIGVQTNGQVLIGGAITQPMNKLGLARLNADGTPDGSFTAYVKRNNTVGFPGLAGTVRKILRRPDGRFYINGIFHAVANVAGYTHLAVLDANGNHDTNFVPSGLDVELLQTAKLTVQNDNKVLVNINSNVVHRLSHAGAVEASMVLTNVVTVHSLTADPNGGFYVAGDTPGEIPVRVRVFRFDAVGVLDTNFNAPLFDSTGGNPAYTLELPLAQPNGKVLVLGNYISVGGVQRGGLCRLNLDGTLDTSFVPGANGVGTIYQGSLIGLDGITRLPDGRFIIYRSGPFRYDSIYRNGVARISSGGALDTAFDPGKGPQGDNFGFSGEGWGMLSTASAADGNIYVGGSFTNFNNAGRQYIARLNGGPASAKPTIDTHPVSQSVSNGVDVTFTVLATGPGTLSYVWKHNNVAIPGANAASLTVTNVDLGDVGAYVVTVANSAGSVIALPAILTVNGVSTPDLTGPNFKVTSPAGTFVLVTTNQFDFRGTAADNQGLGVLLYKQDTNPWTQIGLTTNWAFTVTVNPGTNVFLITVGDTSGNFAVTQRFTAFYSVPHPLGLNVVGNGKINGGTNGQLFEIGKSIALTVTPGTGWVLTNWQVQVNGSPTITTNKAVPFLMASNTVVNATFYDIAKPVLTVTAPTANQRWSNEVFTVAGKVTDNNTNGTVWYQLNGGAWTNASGWTNWNAVVNLTPGTNNVKAFALDAASNRSTTNSVNFVRVLTAPLGVVVVGNGKVNGGTNGQLFEIGKSIALTVTPGTGWLLTNWQVQVNGSPTITTNKAVPFLMASNTVVNATFYDIAKPVLTVTAPTANQRWSNEVFTVAGKVTDNNTNGTVWYQLNGGAWTNASGWTNWNAVVNLTPGTNNVKAFALDAAGNRSTTNSVNFVRVLTAPFCVNIVGNGKVNGATNSQPLELGKGYLLTTTPGTGWILTNWLVQVEGNTVVSTNKAVAFLMQSNLCVTATFYDIAKPVLTVTAPTANQRWSNEVFTVAGKVTDNNTNGTVWYQLNGGVWTNASGWTNWNAVVNLTPGTNNVKAFALDAAGNRSTTNNVNFVRVLTAPLGVVIAGNGKVNGGTNGQPFEIGKSIALTVTPGTGWLLTNWQVQVNGSPTITTNKAVPFLMASNTVVNATFYDIAKPALTVTAPTANQRWSNEVFTVAGKVTDNNTNGTVWYQLNGGAWTNASGWTNWNAVVNLTPGTNNVKAFALDAAGNRSTTNSVNVIYVFLYCLAEYYYPVGQDSRFIYDGLDWDGNPTQLQVVIADTNYPLLTFTGTSPVTSYTQTVMRVQSAYGFYDTNTDQFFPSDDWDEYFVADGCSFGLFGSDDGSESLRVDHGAIFTNCIAVGQTLSLTRNLYQSGTPAGTGTIKLQLLDVSNVTVPAGTFNDCLRIRMTLTAGGSTQAHDDWLAPGVGMVKQQGVSGGGAAERWALIRWQLPASRPRLAATSVSPSAPPTLKIVPNVAGGYSLRLSGQLGSTYVIEAASGGLEAPLWNPVWTGAIEASDVEIPIGTSAPAGFYRARQP